jgi:hypothetical protein
MIMVLADIAGGSQKHSGSTWAGRTALGKTHSPTFQETDMNSLKASIVLLGLITIAGTNVAVAGPKQTASNCFTDDGYGRKRACSSGGVGYKRVKVSTECTTDDGYGRKRSCSQGFKR